jgi:hypothetical protein
MVGKVPEIRQVVSGPICAIWRRRMAWFTQTNGIRHFDRRAHSEHRQKGGTPWHLRFSVIPGSLHARC